MKYSGTTRECIREGDACDSKLKRYKGTEDVTGDRIQFRRTACGNRGKKTASKSANENELKWKMAAHCIDDDTTNFVASGILAYPVEAPRKVLQLGNGPAFQRTN